MESPDYTAVIEASDQTKNWWKERRGNYNLCLLAAGFCAFLCYVVVAAKLIMPYDDEFDITLFEVIPQTIGYFIMMGIANLFYGIGYRMDMTYNNRKSERYRKGLFYWGTGISCILPFWVPVNLVVQYFREFHK